MNTSIWNVFAGKIGTWILASLLVIVFSLLKLSCNHNIQYLNHGLSVDDHFSTFKVIFFLVYYRNQISASQLLTIFCNYELIFLWVENKYLNFCFPVGHHFFTFKVIPFKYNIGIRISASLMVITFSLLKLFLASTI